MKLITNLSRTFFLLPTLCVVVAAAPQQPSTTATETPAASQQGSTSPSAEQTPAQTDKSAAPAAADEAPAMTTDTQPLYVPSLFAPGMITVGQDRNAESFRSSRRQPGRGLNEITDQIVYGFSTGGGYSFGSQASDQQADSGIPVLTPYIGFMHDSQTSGFALQYAPTVSILREPNGERNAYAYHSVSTVFRNSITRRWEWTLSLGGGYGSQGARFLGPLNVRPSPDGTDTTSSLITGSTNNQFQTTDSLSLSWQKSRTQRVSISAQTDYVDVLGENNLPGYHSIAGGLNIAFSQTLNRRVTIGTYGDVNRVFSTPACSTYGGGAELGLVVAREVNVVVGGGPQGGNGSCGGSQFNLHAQLSSPFYRSSQVYLRYNRQLSVAFGQGGQWEDAASVGLSKTFRSVSIGADAGLSHLNTTLPGSRPTGYFGSAYYSHNLTHGINVGISYRQAQYVQQPQGTTKVVMLSFSWQPKPIPVGGR